MPRSPFFDQDRLRTRSVQKLDLHFLDIPSPSSPGASYDEERFKGIGLKSSLEVLGLNSNKQLRWIDVATLSSDEEHHV